MARVKRREMAKRDLIARWVWYAERAGVETADRFLQAAGEAASMLSAQPQAGVRLPVRRAELQGFRYLPLPGAFEKPLLFYTVSDDGIELVRVLHSRRHLARMLAEGLS